MIDGDGKMVPSANSPPIGKVLNMASEGVALVSAPWSLYDRPSIQLGALSAWMKRAFPNLRVDAHHAFLNVANGIGYPRYQAISRRTWLAETIFAALLFPERMDRAEAVFKKTAKGSPALGQCDFADLVATVGAIADQTIDAIDWSAYFLAGFSNCLCQFTATLYFVRRIKAAYADLPVVVGGSMFDASSAGEMMAAFPEIDFVVIGEGERPLSELISHRLAGALPADMPPIDGVVQAGGRSAATGFSQMADLAELPVPDYDDYFALIGTFPPEKRFFPKLNAEFSRGCWWQPGNPQKRGGCAFCNLNLQWNGYRTKSREQMVSEVDALTRRHQVLSVAFTDNAFPKNGAEKAFAGMAALGKDLNLFGEIRAGMPYRSLAVMRRAGLREVQIGIEALSSRLLKKINKGATAIANLEIMRHCQELGIRNRSNLILQFPGSDAGDVAETLRVLDFALTFDPLQPVTFWLGRGSPVWDDPRKFGIRAVFNHPHYAALFPSGPMQQVGYMIQAYRGDRIRQRKLWRPVRQKLRDWERSFATLCREDDAPLLGYQDGGDFLIIRQRRFGRDAVNHRLTGASREIYLFCRCGQSIGRILARFPGFGEDRVLAFLRMMVDKRLVFKENDRYLSLAVRSGR
jgi:ribosomal peptide maturation radical SAM protein 1